MTRAIVIFVAAIGFSALAYGGGTPGPGIGPYPHAAPSVPIPQGAPPGPHINSATHIYISPPIRG